MLKHRIVYIISTLFIVLLFFSIIAPGGGLPQAAAEGVKNEGLPALPEKALIDNLPKAAFPGATPPPAAAPSTTAKATETARETRETVAARQASGQKTARPDSMAEAAAESKENAGELTGRVVILDPGHGGGDPGAVGLSLGLKEDFVNLDTALRLKILLERTGAEVVLTRDNDAFVSLNQRVNIAHDNGAALFISIHANAHTDRTAGGTETYYNSCRLPRKSLRLAELIQQELAEALKLRDIGVKNGDFYVIRAARMPSALVELAFLSNKNEEGLLNQPSFRQSAAEAVWRGIIRFFD